MRFAAVALSVAVLASPATAQESGTLQKINETKRITLG